MIKLTKITADRSRSSFHTDHEEADENPNVQAAPIETAPVMVNPAAIRCFYPRKDNRQGTRITFTDGGGFAVLEDFDRVAELVS